MEKASALETIAHLNELGIALSKEKNPTRLLELILTTAKNLTHADAGTLFMMDDEGRLRFEVMQTEKKCLY